MQCFPQLQTGALGQYPIRKIRSERTVRNVCLDGREIKLADPSGASTEWQLTFQELTDGEIGALEAFYQSMEGRLGTFTFLDPTDNLCAWSGQLDAAVWQTDPLLQVTGSVADPFGGTRAYRFANPAGATLQTVQTLNAPESFHYCLSVYARSEAPGEVTLIRSSQSARRDTDSQWRRLLFASTSAGNQDTVAFGFEIAPGASVEVFGMQVEAQIGASLYKRTTSRAGVYANARFRDDALAITTVGPGRHHCLVAIRSN
jgi:hypothetical protein